MTYIFLPQEKFHCFTGFPPNVREKAIEEIKKALSAADGEGETKSKIDDSLPEQVKNLTLKWDEVAGESVSQIDC